MRNLLSLVVLENPKRIDGQFDACFFIKTQAAFNALLDEIVIMKKEFVKEAEL